MYPYVPFPGRNAIEGPVDHGLTVPAPLTTVTCQLVPCRRPLSSTFTLQSVGLNVTAREIAEPLTLNVPLAEAGPIDDGHPRGTMKRQVVRGLPGPKYRITFVCSNTVPLRRLSGRRVQLAGGLFRNPCFRLGPELLEPSAQRPRPFRNAQMMEAREGREGVGVSKARRSS
jgi:hypothetical protein